MHALADVDRKHQSVQRQSIHSGGVNARFYPENIVESKGIPDFRSDDGATRFWPAVQVPANAGTQPTIEVPLPKVVRGIVAQPSAQYQRNRVPHAVHRPPLQVDGHGKVVGAQRNGVCCRIRPMIVQLKAGALQNQAGPHRPRAVQPVTSRKAKMNACAAKARNVLQTVVVIVIALLVDDA